jgi:hypothetical protein
VSDFRNRRTGREALHTRVVADKRQKHMEKTAEEQLDERVQPSLHELIAEHLGWSVDEAQSFSLPALRELVTSPKLKAAITKVIL